MNLSDRMKYQDQTAQMGNLEYFAELANAPSGDDLARLGTKVSGAGMYHNPTESTNARYFPGQTDASEARQFFQQEGQWPTGNTVYTGSGISVPAVQNHEFRHAGGQYILDNFTREEMVDKWGDEGGEIHNILNYRNEGAMETFDNPNDPAGELGTVGGSMQFVDGPKGTMRPEWTDVLQRRMKDISGDIMYGLGVPRRSKPFGGLNE